MKLKYEMEIIEIDGSPMAVPVDCDDEFRGVLQINDTTMSIIKLLKNDVTEQQLASELKKQYDACDEEILNGINKVVGILREYDLLVE